MEGIRQALKEQTAHDPEDFEVQYDTSQKIVTLSPKELTLSERNQRLGDAIRRGPPYQTSPEAEPQLAALATVTFPRSGLPKEFFDRFTHQHAIFVEDNVTLYLGDLRAFKSVDTDFPDGQMVDDLDEIIGMATTAQRAQVERGLDRIGCKEKGDPIKTSYAESALR
ncbi:MAG: hypothetical protein K940chlam2_00116 [Chlamydiae bacterium]|nr:hypothetical protein [Chlamydiota bacterium]